MNQTNAEIWRYRWLWIGVLTVLVIVLLLGIRCNPAEVDVPGEPLCRITYYLAEDGTVCTVVEKLGDHDLNITFPEGILPPVEEIGGYDGTIY